jgi:hypothetical protein
MLLLGAFQALCRGLYYYAKLSKSILPDLGAQRYHFSANDYCTRNIAAHNAANVQGLTVCSLQIFAGRVLLSNYSTNPSFVP